MTRRCHSWGSAELNTALVFTNRHEETEEALLAARDAARAVDATPSEVTAVLEEVSTLRKQALEQGQAVRDAITVDSQRTGRLIAELDY